MFYPLLFENPNAIYLEEYHEAIEWPQVKTLAFSYYNDIMYVGDVRSTHVILYKNARVKDDFAESRSGRGKYAGRLFITSKIITFWDFPETNEILDKILEDIEEETQLRFDDSWRVEVPTMYYKDNDNRGGWGSWHPKSGSQKFISIDKYDGGFARSEQEMRIPHITPPIEKERLRVGQTKIKGFGSDKTAWDSPDNIRVRQQRTTSESVKPWIK